MSDLAPAELRAALEQTFRWLQRNLSEFSLSNACNAEEKLHLLKPLGELALAMDIVERVQPGRFAARDISHWCWDELGQGEVLVETLTIRPDLIVGATLYACFHRAGLRSPRLDRLIEFLCRSPSALNVELPKWRRLDVEHGFEGLGLSSF